MWGCCFKKGGMKRRGAERREREWLMLGSGFRTRIPNVWLNITVACDLDVSNLGTKHSHYKKTSFFLGCE